METPPRHWLQVLLLIACTCLVYVHAPQAQFLNLDDRSLVFQNPIVRRVDQETVRLAWTTFDPELYIPLTLTSYQLEHLLFGMNPAVFHTTNVLLHIANSILVLFLLRFFTKSWIVPFIAALLFAVHPIQTEAVMWVSARKDLLSAFFFLLSTLLYCIYSTREKKPYLYWSLVAFLCALLSKVVAATLPLVLLLVDDMLHTERLPTRTREKWLYAVPAILFVGVGMLKKTLSVFAVSYAEAVLLAIKGTYSYLETLVLPTNLSLLYEQTTPIVLVRHEFLFPLLILLMIAVIGVTSRAFGKALSFGLLWFGITLLPNVANAAKGYSGIYYASDRYAYIPSVGIFFLAGVGIAWLLTAYPQWKKLIVAGCIVVTATYASVTYAYTKVFIDSKAMFTYVTNQDPHSGLGHMMLGMAYTAEGDDSASVQAYKKARTLMPEHTGIRYHLGLAMMKTGNIDGGMQHIREGIAINSSLLGRAYLAYGHLLEDEYAAAETVLQDVLEEDPNHSTALLIYGQLEEERGNADRAKQYYERSLEVEPDSLYAKAALQRVLSKE